MLFNEALWWACEPLRPIESSIGNPLYPLPDINMDNHWIIQTFDFHVTDMLPWLCTHVADLDKVIADYDPKLGPLNYADLLRKVIWSYYSSVRFCLPCKKSDPLCGHQVMPDAALRYANIWKHIKEHVEHYSSHKRDEQLSSFPKRKTEISKPN
jgi:hypothetical protein